jgi:hypothetical protein
MNRSRASSLSFTNRTLHLRALSLLAALCCPVVAQDKESTPRSDLPKAEVVLDKTVDALGGRAALEKLHNRVTKGTFEFVGMGIKATITVYESAPNKQYVILVSEGLGTIEEGTDGTVCWEASQMTGPRVKHGAEQETALHEATFNKELHWRKLYTKAETVAIEDVAGKSCYKLVMTPTVGEPETWYIEKDTHLLLKSEATYVSQMGNIPIEAWASDYKQVDGVMISFTTRIKFMGGERLFTIETIEHNVDLPEDRFEPPAAIKALLETTEGQPAPEPPAKRSRGPEIG